VIIGCVELESRGFTLRAEPDGSLVVSPGGRLSSTERDWLRQYKNDLLAAIAYITAQCERPL
jgi:hypothetical protein